MMKGSPLWIALAVALVSPWGATAVPTDLSTLDTTVRHRVRGVYFTPSDRPFPPDIQERLDTLIQITRDFYRDEMAGWGYRDEHGRGKTFLFESEDQTTWDVIYMVGNHPASAYQAAPTDQHPWGAPGACLEEIVQRLPSGLYADNVMFYLYDTFEVASGEFVFTGNAGAPAAWEGEGAGYLLQGTHVLGPPDFHTVATSVAEQAPIFFDTTPSGFINHAWNGEWRELTRGELASVSLGIPIHEIGHAFYLPHIFSDTDGDGVENNIMGNGFRRFGGRFGMPGAADAPTILSPEAAELLNANPLFNQPDPFPPDAPGSGFHLR